MTALTFGAQFSVSEPPRAAGSLWSHIAVVHRPGWPIVVDPACARNTIFFIGRESWTALRLDEKAP